MTELKMSEKQPMAKETHNTTFRKPGELQLRTNLFTHNMKSGSRILHSTALENDTLRN